jgi:HD-GYP domain-containing protein (c-di-GMP phosphodiesterase class II)
MVEKENITEETQLVDFRILHNYNWFFIGILWAIFFLELKLISFWHATTFASLLLIYSGVHFYNSKMKGEISNNEIITMAIINVFACIPLLYYAPGFEQEAWILFVWAGIAVSTFNRMRNIVLLLALFASILVFISFFQGQLSYQHEIAILLLKIAIIFFVGLTFATMQKTHQKRTRRIEEVTSVAIISLAKLTESRDKETGAHLERIRRYTEALATELRKEERFKDYITEKYIKELAQSSILHDIGKVGIPDHILLKKGPLTTEEQEQMKKHSDIGGDSLKEAQQQIGGESFLSLAQEIAYYHHEKYDGTGYPKGLKGEEIPLSARIVSRRPYKNEIPHENAMNIIREEMAGSFDPLILRAMDRIHRQFRDIAVAYS